MQRFRPHWLIYGAVFFLFFNGCGLSSILTPTPTETAPKFDELAATAAMQLTLTVSPNGSQVEDQSTNPGVTQAPCAYTWDIRSLPEETDMAQKALNVAGLSEVKIIAEAYGENCIVTQTNQVLGFTILETDFRITISIGNIDDERVKSRLLTATLKEIIAMPQETFPGTRPGMVKVRFVSGELEDNIQFQLEEAKKALASGLENEALLQALR